MRAASEPYVLLAEEEDASLKNNENRRDSTTRDWATYFDSQNIKDEEEGRGSAVSAEMRLDEDAPQIPDLSERIRANIKQVFSVYFEGSHAVSKSKLLPIYSILSYFNATMPLSQPFILSSFGHFKQVILFMELSLRGISQVFFQNNPLSGFLILVGLLVQSPRIGLYGLLALFSGNLTAYGLGFDSGLVRSGLFGYNAFLVGLVIATFDSPDEHAEYPLVMTLFVIVISSFSSILLVALGKLLHPYKSPPLTLPFNLATYIFLLATANMFRVEYAPIRPPALPDFGTQAFGQVTAAQLFGGTIRGIGQVYLADNLTAGFLILAGIAVSSRVAAGVALFGSFIGAGIALATGVSPAAVEAGMYGYNASLSVTALFTFYCPSKGTTILASFAGIMTVLAQQALTTMLEPLGLPTMTMPFCVIALPFIILQGTTPLVVAIPLSQLTVPEDHLRRVRVLKEGTNYLKECLHPEEKRAYSSKSVTSFRQIDKAMDIDNTTDQNRKKIGYARIFDAIVTKKDFSWTKTKPGSVTVESFCQALTQAGLSQTAGRRFASLVFNLTDLDRSNSIDKKEFIALCLVSCAVVTIRCNISEFFFFVDLNGNGWIDFEELDSSLEYLGEPALSEEERDSLTTMTGMKEDCEMEVVELINLLTVHKLKLMVAAYHNSTDMNTSTKEEPSC